MTIHTDPRQSPGAFLALCLAGLALVGCPDDPLRIAIVLPLEGPDSDYGHSVLEGTQLAHYEMLEDRTGKDRWQLQILDSRSEPDLAESLLEEGFDNGAFAAVGFAAQGKLLSLARVAATRHRPLLSVGAAEDALPGAGRTLFQLGLDPRAEGLHLLHFARAELGIERCEILRPLGLPASSPFASTLSQGSSSTLEAEATEPSSPEIGPNRRSCVVLAGSGPDLEHSLPLLRKAGFRGWLLASSLIDAGGLLGRLGTDAEGALLALPVSGPESSSFTARFLERFGHEPDLFSALGYDSILALHAAHLTQSSPRQLWKGLRGLAELPGASGSITFDPEGRIRRFLRVHQIRDGRPVDRESELKERIDDLRRRRRALADRHRDPQDPGRENP